MPKVIQHPNISDSNVHICLHFDVNDDVVINNNNYNTQQGQLQPE